MLKIQNLKAGYGEMEILHGIDLNVSAGEIVSLIGPNGAGKTTILKSIFGLAEIYGGKIFFHDNEITKLKTFQLIDLGISYVPQGRQIFSNMTVLENLEMGVFNIEDKNLVAKKIEDIFAEFPILKDKQEEKASSLSGGQQQLLAIARALIQDPQILLLDEPSLGLAPKTMREIFEKIIEIKSKGVAILMVEQNAKQAIEISDRTYVLENGKIALGGGKDILENEKIKEIYFGGV